MAMNTISLDFRPCEPAPVNGYKVSYRPVGAGSFREVPGRFFSSPIEFSTTLDPSTTQYEGFIQGDCGGGKLGIQSTWIAGEPSGGSASPGGGGGGSTPPIEGTQILVGMGADEALACSDNRFVYVIPPDSDAITGVTLYTDAACTLPVAGEAIVRSASGATYNMLPGGLVGTATGNTC
jgi:hypothetical protein